MFYYVSTAYVITTFFRPVLVVYLLGHDLIALAIELSIKISMSGNYMSQHTCNTQAFYDN